MKKFLYYLPRALAMFYVFYLSLLVFANMFSLDAISYFLPIFILVVITSIAWLYWRIGGILFILLGIFLMLVSNFESLIIFLPAILIGILFWLGKEKPVSKKPKVKKS